MRRRARAFISSLAVSLGLAVLCSAPTALAQDPSQKDEPHVEVSVSRPNAALDEPVRLTYSFSGPGVLNDLRAPSPLPLKNLKVVGGPMTSTQISFNNFSRSQLVTVTYFVQGLEVGSAEVETSVWTIGGKPVRARGLGLEIGPARGAAPGGPDPQEDLFNRFGIPRRPRAIPNPSAARATPIVMYLATPEKTTAYVGEEIEVHYELITQADVQGLEFVEPPKFPGFWAEDLEKPERPKGRQEVYEGRRVTRFTLLKKLISGLTPGPATLPTASIRVGIRSPVDPFEDPFAWMEPRQIQLNTKPIEIKVLAVPGVPSFAGPVGRFELTASVNRGSVKSGEAVNLKVRLAGSGNLRTATDPPKVEIAGARVYPPTTKMGPSRVKGATGSSIDWEFVVIPESAGSLTVPSIRLNVFDPAERRVIAKATAPIRVDVEGTQVATASSPVVSPQIRTTAVSSVASSPATDGSASAATIETSGQAPEGTGAPLAAVGTDKTSGQKDRVKPGPKGAGVDLSSPVAVPLWLLIALPASAVVAGGAGLLLRGRYRARSLVRQAVAPEPGETKERAANRIDRAVRRVVAKRYAVDENLAGPAFLEALVQAGAPEKDRSDVSNLLSEVDFLRFAPQLGDYADRIEKVRQHATRLLVRLT